MLIGLIIILGLVLTLPFFIKKVEENLEIFLFLMGLSATLISRVFHMELIGEILTNKLLYFITFAVLIAGILFKILKNRVKGAVDAILKRVSLKVFIFFLILILGIASSFITAIISALLLVEIINVLPLSRKDKVNLDIIACFSIGLGAVLTPVGEPLATIVISKLNQDFWFFVRLLGVYVLTGAVALGIFGAFFVGRGNKAKDSIDVEEGNIENTEETYKDVFIRAGKIFLFIFALELLGAGFKPLIDRYVINLHPGALYFINMISAVLDNATLAAAEISSKMSPVQIKAILMGLLISGGMLIPGNIPNIISAGKLKVSSKEWARLGLPLGAALMIIYFIVIFVV